MYLIVTKTFPPEVGGMQNLMWGLANELSKHYMIKVYADYHENHKLFDEQVSFSIERVGGIKLLRKYRKAQLINEFIKENKIDGIIADHWKSLEKINSDLLKNKKTICLIHSKEINHPVNSSINKRVLKTLSKTNYIVSNSNFTKKLAVNLNLNEEKIVVINPGVEKNISPSKENILIANELFKNSFPKLITVSRFDKRKNHEKVIMTVRNLKEKFPNIKYLCIGYGEEESNLKKLVKQLKIEDVVIFKKNISLDLKSAFLLQSDLFIMPSIIYKKSVEGFGISFIEAAQQGTPSIGGKDGGAVDSILHEETGLICDGNDLNSIYESILKILENNKYKIYGKNAKEFSKQFDWDIIVKKYLKLLN